jgi:hypothetical protein
MIAVAVCASQNGKAINFDVNTGDVFVKVSERKIEMTLARAAMQVLHEVFWRYDFRQFNLFCPTT